MHFPQRSLHRAVLLILTFLLLLPGTAVLSSPKDPGEPQSTLSPAGGGPILLAKRRRYGRYKRKQSLKAKPSRRRRKVVKPPPQVTSEPTPESDLAEPSTTTPAPNVDPGALQRGGRVEFDGRLVQGQTAKSGAIYLFARKRTQLRSMVEERTNYRKEILRTVYPRWEKEVR